MLKFKARQKASKNGFNSPKPGTYSVKGCQSWGKASHARHNVYCVMLTVLRCEI